MRRDRPGAVAVRRAVQRLGRRLRSERPHTGLTGLELQALAVLMDYGPSTSARLADRMRTTPQALTRTITSLTSGGLVCRAATDHDKRQYLLTISDAGWEALRAEAAPQDAWLRRGMESLTEAECAVLEIAAGLMTRLVTEDSS